jgi:FdhD protein
MNNSAVVNAVANRQVLRIFRPSSGASGGTQSPPSETFEDSIAVEEPLEIRVAGDTLAITMRTPGGPGDDEKLALGFLFAEGLIAGPDDVTRIIHCGKPGTPEARNVLDVIPAGGAQIDREKSAPSRRGTLTTSACGVCGRTTIDDVLARIPARDRGPASDNEAELQKVNPASSALLFAAIDALASRQPVFARTGGLHCAVICDASGVLASAEDVGRHNAVDKAIGALLLKGELPGKPSAASRVLAVSGRTSFEIVQKAAMARLTGIASVSAPSSLAIDLAKRAGLILAGFARGERMNVYSGG